MTSWQAVLTAALMGAERRELSALVHDSSRDAGVGTADPAALLLDEAAVLTVTRRAGRRPEHAELAAAPEPDPRPAVSQAAGRRLARIVGGENADLLTEWLIAAATRGLRPPPQYLPLLLDRARRIATVEDAGLRALVALAGGPRARWLAALNPAWAYLLEQPLPAALPRLEYLDRTAFAERVTLAMRQLSNAPQTANRDLRAAGRQADPALGAPGALADFPPEAPNSLHNLLSVVRFRYEMLQELSHFHEPDEGSR